jgi:erythromycin esterase-like protein
MIIEKLLPYLMTSLFYLLVFINNCLGQNQLTELISNAIIPIDSSGQLTIEFKQNIRTSLENVKVVALGESLHEDGLTFEHKVNLVKYLHEDLGFNVIAFEYAFFGNWNTNESLKQGNDVKEATKYSGWSKSKYAFPVYEYISQTHQTYQPLNYAGFDGEKVPNGIPDIQRLLTQIIGLIDYKLSGTDHLLLDSLISAVYGEIGNSHKDAISYNRRIIARVLIKDIQRELNLKRKFILTTCSEMEFIMYTLTLNSILMDEKSTYAGSFWNIVRDKHMAERVKWLIDSLYKGEKIILWGASAHFARNMINIKRNLEPDDYGFYPYLQMGDWLYTFYGDAFYSIAFTSASGKTGLIFPENHKFKKYEEIKSIPKPHVNSFEGISFLTDQEALFCDLRLANEKTWLNTRFLAYPFGYNQDFASWKKVLDAFYFIREMKPDEWHN